MLVKRHTALSPHWAAARHARSAQQSDESCPGLPDAPALERLAAEAREGDRNALEELASLLQLSVWRFAYHLSGSREVAEEACQET